MWNVEGEQPKGPSRVARIRSSRPGLLWWVYSIETRAEADLLKHGFLHDLAFPLVRLLIGLGILNVILPPFLCVIQHFLPSSHDHHRRRRFLARPREREVQVPLPTSHPTQIISSAS